MFSMTCDAIADGGKFPELFLGPGHGANVAPSSGGLVLPPPPRASP